MSTVESGSEDSRETGEDGVRFDVVDAEDLEDESGEEEVSIPFWFYFVCGLALKFYLENEPHEK